LSSTTEFIPSQTHNINFDFDGDQQQQQQQLIGVEQEDGNLKGELGHKQMSPFRTGPN
jgi:hypothetical protein